MSRPTIIINDLDAERIDILLEQPASIFCWSNPPMLVCQSPTR